MYLYFLLAEEMLGLWFMGCFGGGGVNASYDVSLSLR